MQDAKSLHYRDWRRVGLLGRHLVVHRIPRADRRLVEGQLRLVLEPIAVALPLYLLLQGIFLSLTLVDDHLREPLVHQHDLIGLVEVAEALPVQLSHLLEVNIAQYLRHYHLIELVAEVLQDLALNCIGLIDDMRIRVNEGLM